MQVKNGYDEGVMIVADALVSFGSMLRLKGISRLMIVNEYTTIGANGDFADFKYLQEIIEEKV